MPGNSKTRRGNGPGHGGPAKGAGHRLKPAGDPDSDAARAMAAGIKPGDGKKTVAEMLIERGGRELAVQRWIEILDNPSHPHHATMVAKLADRTDGAPVQPVSGEGGGPVVFRVITGVPRAE